MTTYPDDPDGAVLADLAAQGVDMSKSLLIEFPVAVPDESSAEGCSKALAKAGYDSRIYYDEGEPDNDPDVDDEDEFGPSWTVYADVRMIPEYSEIMRIQTELDGIARPFGGKSDGWGVMLKGDARRGSVNGAVRPLNADYFDLIMKKYISTVILGLIVAVIWGYFSDLRNGQVGWFIGRLVFVPLVGVVVHRLFAGKDSGEKKA